MKDEYVEVTIAVPIRLAIKKGNAGSLFGIPIETFRAKFSGTFDVETFSDASAEHAAWQMARRLAGCFN
jgi:hypothetical protein